MNSGEKITFGHVLNLIPDFVEFIIKLLEVVQIVLILQLNQTSHKCFGYLGGKGRVLHHTWHASPVNWGHHADRDWSSRHGRETSWVGIATWSHRMWLHVHVRWRWHHLWVTHPLWRRTHHSLRNLVAFLLYRRGWLLMLLLLLLVILFHYLIITQILN